MLAALAAVELVRALHQPWLLGAISVERLIFAWAVILPIVSAAASVATLWRGWHLRRSYRALAVDAATIVVAFVFVLILSLGGAFPDDAAFVLLLVAIALRVVTPLLVSDVAVPGVAFVTRGAAAFVAANLVLVLALALWPLPDACALGCPMRSRWLPFGLALATALSLALARRDPSGHVYRRHALLWLTVPAAFALTGWRAEPDSMAGVPVVALATGIALHGLAALLPSATAETERLTGPLLGATVLAAALALLPWVRTVQVTESDEPHYLITMESLVEDRDLDLRDDYDAADYGDYYPVVLEARHVIDVGDRQMPIRDPGLPLLGAIPFAVGRRTGVLVLMCAVVALFAWRGYALLRRLGFRHHTALLATAAVSLLHPLFTYTTQVYPDTVGALVGLFVAEQLSRPATPTRLAVASALVGVFPWLSTRHWLVAVGMGLVVAVVALAPLARGEWRRAARLALAGALPFAALTGAFVVLDFFLYGLPVPNAGYLAIRDQYNIETFTPWIGVPGLLLDRTFGLLSHVPLFALAFLGAGPLWRRWRETGSPAIAALFLGWLVYFAYIADIYYWWADGAPPSRYQLASIAFLLPALAGGLELVRGRVGMLLAGVAAAWSVAVTLLYALLPHIRYDIVANIAPTGGPGYLWVTVTHMLRANPGLLFPSMTRAAPLDYVQAGLWMAVLLGLGVVGFRMRSSPASLASHTA